MYRLLIVILFAAALTSCLPPPPNPLPAPPKPPETPETPAPSPVTLEAAYELTAEEVSFEAAGTTVHGTLTRPAAVGPFPALLFIAGSGPTDRDWNSTLLPGNNGSGQLLAEDRELHPLVVQTIAGWLIEASNP